MSAPAVALASADGAAVAAASSEAGGGYRSTIGMRRLKASTYGVVLGCRSSA